MDKEQFEDLMSKVAESVASVVKKDSDAKSIGEIMHQALTEHTESWQSKIALEEEAKAKAVSELAEVQSSLEETKKELDQLKNEAAAKAAVDLFNDRMNFIDASYEFNEKELELVTAEVKELEPTEEAFDSYKGKLEIVFSHKLKSNIEAQEADIKARIEEAVASKKSEDQEDSEDGYEEELEIEAGDEAEASLPNNNAQDSEKVSLIARLRKDFNVEVTN